MKEPTNLVLTVHIARIKGMKALLSAGVALRKRSCSLKARVPYNLTFHLHCGSWNNTLAACWESTSLVVRLEFG